MDFGGSAGFDPESRYGPATTLSRTVVSTESLWTTPRSGGTVREPITPSTGETVALPLSTDTVVYRAVFPANREAVGDLLSRGVEQIRATPRRAGVTFLAVEYHRIGDEAIESHDEFSVVFPAVQAGARSWPVASLAAHGTSGYVWYLPVTTELAAALGVDIWGYPKPVADIDHDDHVVASSGETGPRNGQKALVTQPRTLALLIPMVSKYDFWVLDLDGTLVDVQPDYVSGVFEEVGNRLDYRFTERQTKTIWHGLGGSRNERLAEWGVDVERFWETFHDVEDPQARAERTYLYDDADFVAELDTPVGLVTHCQQYLTDPVLDRLDIRDWFDTVVCCTEDIGWKPDPAPVEKAMGEMGVAHDGSGTADPRRAGVLAGDGPHDIGAAWNAGLDGIHVERHSPDRRGQCVLGDHRVESFSELREDPVDGD